MENEEENSKEKPKKEEKKPEQKKSRFSNIRKNILLIESGYNKTDDERIATLGDYDNKNLKINPKAFGPYQQRIDWVNELNTQNKKRGLYTQYTLNDSKTLDVSAKMVEEWLDNVVPRLESLKGGPLSDAEIASAYHLGRPNLTMNDIKNDLEYQSKYFAAVKYNNEQEAKKAKELASKPAEQVKTLAPQNPTSYPTAAPLQSPEKDWLDTSMEWMNQHNPF